MSFIDEHIDKILKVYTDGDYYNLLRDAKVKYTELTGKLDEDTSEYESRMHTFNEWFIFNFRRADGRRVIDDYIQDENIDSELAKSFHNTNYSLFHFVKINFRKQIVLKDILHDDKIILRKEDCEVGLFEDDLFIGRIVTVEKRNYLLKGVCTLPRETLNILKKQSKKVRKLNSNEQEHQFLLTLEKLKIKSINYGHINAENIFVFN